MKNRNRYLIGRAGYWPDVARSQPKYNRPTWHYQLGETLSIGEVEVPVDPVELDPKATLETQELYAIQAIHLCRNVLKDSQSAGERALAVSWLCHLVADISQPCHAGSLYVEHVFPEGDRGANSIPVKQGRNLHAL